MDKETFNQIKEQAINHVIRLLHPAIHTLFIFYPPIIFSGGHFNNMTF